MNANDLYVKVYKPTADCIFVEDKTNYKVYKSNPDVIVFKEGTDDEFLMVPINLTERFSSVILSRDDFDAIGRDCSNVDDNKMDYIAHRIGEVMVENLFWEQLEFWADELNMPKIDDYDNGF